MKIDHTQLLDIARCLENNYNIYLNMDSGEYRALPDVNELMVDSHFHSDELRKITNHWENYIIITKMESWEIFDMMKEFTNEVEAEFQNKLQGAFYKVKPFDHFWYLIESSPYNDQWLNFKENKYISYAKEQLMARGIGIADAEDGGGH